MQTETELHNIIEILAKYYQDFLAESEAYDGASFWSNDKVNELAGKLLVKSQLRKEIDGLKQIDQDDFGANYSINVDTHNDAINDVLNLPSLQETK